MYEVLEDEDGYFVFPAGDPMMDKNLVSDVLLWLDKYSGAKKTYVNALKQYAMVSTQEMSLIILEKHWKLSCKSFYKMIRTWKIIKVKSVNIWQLRE